MVNRGRIRRRRVNEEIEMEEWKEYFMRILGGGGSRGKSGGGERENVENRRQRRR